jgi:hypothetical protein
MKWSIKVKLFGLVISFLMVLGLVGSTLYTGTNTIDVYFEETGRINFTALSESLLLESYHDSLRSEVYKALTYSFTPSVASEHQVFSDAANISSAYLSTVNNVTNFEDYAYNQRELEKIQSEVQNYVNTTNALLNTIYSSNTRAANLFSQIRNYESLHQKLKFNLRNLIETQQKNSETYLAQQEANSLQQIKLIMFSMFFSLALGTLCILLLVRRFTELKFKKASGFLNCNAQMMATTKEQKAA